MMEITDLSIPEVKLIKPKIHIDNRGFFFESYNKNDFDSKVSPIDFVQDNISFSEKKYTVRGLHYQLKPFEQDKLVSVLSGRIIDIAVDIRKDSEFFGKYVAKEIDSKSCNKILVPKGFAHGFITLDDNTYVSYKTSNFYSAENDKGINIFDKQINITELPEKNLITISSKDSMLPNIDVAELF